MMLRKVLIGAFCLSAVVTGVYQAGCILKEKTEKNREKKLLEKFQEIMSREKENNLLFGKLGRQEIGISLNSEISGARNTNVLVVGDTGTGKSYQYMLSNLLNADASFVVFDPYRNLLKEYGANFEEKGFELYSVEEEWYSKKFETEFHSLGENIRKQKSIVFLNVKDAEFATDFVTDIYEQIEQNREGKHVLFWLDEICNMEKISKFPKMLASARTNHAGFQIIVQSFSELEEKYGNKYSSIIMNCDTVISTGAVICSNMETLVKYFNVDAEDCKRTDFTKNLVIERGFSPVVCDKLNPAISE